MQMCATSPLAQRSAESHFQGDNGIKTSKAAQSASAGTDRRVEM